MMTVFGCIVREHNLWLVQLSALLCGAGAWVTARLFQRTIGTSGRQRLGWYFLTALSAGAAIWCTHFVAMLGFDAGAPVGFDPVLTIVSLLIAIIGATGGFAVAGGWSVRTAPAIGGALVGLSIAAMHYTGMLAYRVQGIVSWDHDYLIASIILSVGFSAAALHFAMRGGTRSRDLMPVFLALAIVSLHFTAMTAFRVQPMAIDGSFSNPEALHALALGVAAMALLIVGTGLVSYLIDDSTRAEAVERLRRMALTDSLTGLPNRANFNERLDLEIELAGGRGGTFALIGIDLNRFKEINDVRGHAAGDAVLHALGRRIKGLLRDGDGEFVARTGGDEFTAICRVEEPGSVPEFAARLEAALCEPVQFNGLEIVAGASFGVAIWPDDAVEREAIINNADLAMYRAKSNPLRNVCFYEAGMDEKMRARRALAADLRDALARDQLSLHYQVQMAVSTGQIRGYEALLRWDHPQIGPIPPDEFVPLAEENGLILPIGEWVLRTACREAASWDPPYKIAVNLSAVQFLDTDLQRLVMEVLMDTGLAPERLELELTESAIFADRERALHLLRQIKALGVSIALDDFGTGYSSLDTLRSFPFDRIKIDRSFFGANKGNEQTIAIIRAVLALGRSFGIPVLAEGIETYDQLSMLNAEGCDEAQGFLLGLPSELDRIVEHGQIAQKPSAAGDEVSLAPIRAPLRGADEPPLDSFTGTGPVLASRRT